MTYNRTALKSETQGMFDEGLLLLVEDREKCDLDIRAETMATRMYEELKSMGCAVEFQDLLVDAYKRLDEEFM